MHQVPLPLLPLPLPVVLTRFPLGRLTGLTLLLRGCRLWVEDCRPARSPVLASLRRVESLFPTLWSSLHPGPLRSPVRRPRRLPAPPQRRRMRTLGPPGYNVW